MPHSSLAVHAAVLRRLREVATEKVLAAPDEVALSALFLNYRHGCGLRLTLFGLALLEPLAFHYKIALTAVRATDIAQLESRLTMPYFVNDKRIVLFEEEAAVLLRLNKGDLRTFIRNT